MGNNFIHCSFNMDSQLGDPSRFQLPTEVFPSLDIITHKYSYHNTNNFNVCAVLVVCNYHI